MPVVLAAPPKNRPDNSLGHDPQSSPEFAGIRSQRLNSGAFSDVPRTLPHGPNKLLAIAAAGCRITAYGAASAAAVTSAGPCPTCGGSFLRTYLSPQSIPLSTGVGPNATRFDAPAARIKASERITLVRPSSGAFCRWFRCPRRQTLKARRGVLFWQALKTHALRLRP
jgi:hypothetical protein